MNTLTDTHTDWPSMAQLLSVLQLQDYNTRVVVIGTVLLGIAAGMIGTFMLLRKRALMGDAISHATLPGIGIAFLVMAANGGSGRWLPGLLLGAVISGLIGMGSVLLVRSQSRLKEDAALGIVLSVFFGLGVAILGIIQQLSLGHAAGLESFIYGKTASMLARDAWLIAATAMAVLLFCVMFFKEFGLICFDQQYAGSQGWNVALLDVIMMALVVVVTVIGLQAVGLILMIALLVTPPAAARFWTSHLTRMMIISALIGAVSGYCGSAISALMPRLPAGAVIVIVAGACFLVSMIFGTERGILKRVLRHAQLSRRVELHHLLRALYEWNEQHQPDTADSLAAHSLQKPMGRQLLAEARSWSLPALLRVLRRSRHKGFVRIGRNNDVQLTREGFHEAWRVVRNHRLWETFLVTHADIATVHVDSSADEIEHVLGVDMVTRLEALLQQSHPELVMPESPHIISRLGVPA